jgi:hypothetical protein
VIETVPKKVGESATGDYSDRYSPEEWKSLFEELKGLPHFKLRVKSSPGDVLRYVYEIGGEREVSIHEYYNKIVFVVTDKGVHVEKQYYRDELLDDVVKCLFEYPLNKMPLYINDKRYLVKKVANWRLRCAV